MAKQDRQPRERSETLRQEIVRHLLTAPLTARELSALVRLPEKDVIDHLENLARSKSHRLLIDPAACRSCGYTFEQRRRPSKPGKCPRCREQRIDEPTFWIESAER